jgi:hypothetical protein
MQETLLRRRRGSGGFLRDIEVLETGKKKLPFECLLSSSDAANKPQSQYLQDNWHQYKSCDEVYKFGINHLIQMRDQLQGKRKKELKISII